MAYTLLSRVKLKTSDGWSSGTIISYDSKGNANVKLDKPISSTGQSIITVSPLNLRRYSKSNPNNFGGVF